MVTKNNEIEFESCTPLDIDDLDFILSEARAFIKYRDERWLMQEIMNRKNTSISTNINTSTDTNTEKDQNISIGGLTGVFKERPYNHDKIRSKDAIK